MDANSSPDDLIDELGQDPFLNSIPFSDFMSSGCVDSAASCHHVSTPQHPFIHTSSSILKVDHQSHFLKRLFHSENENFGGMGLMGRLNF